MKSSQQNIKENKRSMIKLAISQSKIKMILMLVKSVKLACHER